MNQPIRILHIVSYMQRGGLETFIMNCYRHIDREKIQFDFLVHRMFRADYDDEIEALGGRIYRMPRLNPIGRQYKKALKNFFAEHKEYRIVHSHLDCMSGIPLQVAKEHGVPVRIAHSHSSNQEKDWKYPLKLYYKRNIPKTATELFACSEKAGEWMFSGSAFSVIKNGIEAEKFVFNNEIRQNIRCELGIKDELVIGHVGRFMPVKNHEFIIDIFEKVHLLEEKSVLLLVGTGELKERIEKKVSELGLVQNVIFAGIRTNIHEIMQAMDVFVLPSINEGLPLVLVEAQTAGLQCFVNGDGVSEEAAITEYMNFISIKESSEIWAKKILANVNRRRINTYQMISDAEYNINCTVEKLMDFYLNAGRIE